MVPKKEKGRRGEGGEEGIASLVASTVFENSDKISARHRYSMAGNTRVGWGGGGQIRAADAFSS